MVTLKLALDTSVFKSSEFCNWLLLEKDEKFLPVIAYMEYLHHHLKKGNTESMVDAFLQQMNITIVPFSMDEAIIAAKRGVEDPHFNENAREYAIASTAAILNAKLVTTNIHDYKWLENVVTPDEILEGY